MLKQFGHEVWTADGPDVVIVGFRYPTRMAVIGLSDGRLFIWSPIQLTDILRAEVDTLGQSAGTLLLPEFTSPPVCSRVEKRLPRSQGLRPARIAEEA